MTTKAPSRPGKRKLADTTASATPPPAPLDSTTVSLAPQLVPTPFVPPVPGFYLTRGHPINKPNFRYVPCGPAPSSSPTYPLYRVIASPPVGSVRFSWEDRSQYIGITEDALCITADKGYRSARANVPLREGSWFFEVIVERGGGELGTWKGGGSHVRVGVGRRESPLTAPVGFDGYSYGIRDQTGEAVTLSQPRSYGKAFGTGDIIGVLVTLPERRKADEEDEGDPAHLRRKRVPIRYKGQLYFESLEYKQSTEMNEVQEAMANVGQVKKVAPKVKAAAPGTRAFVPVVLPTRPLDTLEGSSIEFFKNGESLGVAFEDLYDFLPLRPHPRPAKARPPAPGSDAARECHHDDGTLGYYPFVSCYGGGIARLNPGPQFAHPPSASTARPLFERYDEYVAETLALDERDEEIWRAAIDLEQVQAAKRLHAADVKKAKSSTRGKLLDSPAAGTPEASADDGMQVDLEAIEVREDSMMEVDGMS